MSGTKLVVSPFIVMDQSAEYMPPMSVLFIDTFTRLESNDAGPERLR